MYDEFFPNGLPASPIEDIKGAGLPVFLYGMGNGAEKMMKVCEEYGIDVEGVFASDGFRAGKIFLGFTVMSLSEVAAKYTDGFIALVCFGCPSADMRAYLGRVKRAGGIVYMPHLPLFGGELFTADHFKANEDRIFKAYSLLRDGRSRALFKDILTYCLTWDAEVLFFGETNSFAYPAFFEGKEFKTAIDGGAYRGDTVLSMHECFPSINRFLAFEPDPANYTKLSQVKIEKVQIESFQKGLHQAEGELRFAALKNRGSHFAEDGIKVPVTSIDSVTDEKIDLIKLDVEGCEREAIIGAEKTIKKNHPALCVSLYHKTDDIFELILQLHEISPHYEFSVFRADVCPAWDIILLAK